MNQLDLDRMQEKVEITAVARMDNSPWSVVQGEYSLNFGTRLSGSYVDTQAVDGFYETFAENTTGSPWLSGWNKRIKIAIDHNSIGSVLINFPVMVYLSNSSGRFGNDVSSVFDELQNSNNRKKIAITKSDGITQCYVEIENWDATNKRAWLWTRVPVIDSSHDTFLYLYYDRYQMDNTAFVGDTGSSAAANVWDSNFRLVLHFGEKTGPNMDSTSNNNTGTPQGGVTQSAQGVVDGADAFNGVDGKTQITDNPNLDFTGDEITMEAYVKLDSLPTTEASIARKDNQWQIGFINSHTIRNLVQTGGSDGWTVANDENFPFQTGTWYYWTFTYDGSKITDLLDAQQVGSTHTVTGNIICNSAPLYIGYCVYSGGYLNGIIDEIRISDNVRSPSWIKASYETNRDNLLSFGAEEAQSGQPQPLGVVGAFSIDLNLIPLIYIQTLDIQLIYRTNDSSQSWYLEAFNWTSGHYADQGFNSTAGQQPTTGWNTYIVNLMDQLRSYLSDSGTIYLELHAAQVGANQTSIDIDFLGVTATVSQGATISLENKGSVTAHLVALWVDSPTIHQRYTMNLILDAGDSVNYTSTDIDLADNASKVKIVTERGNLSVFSVS